MIFFSVEDIYLILFHALSKNFIQFSEIEHLFLFCAFSSIQRNDYALYKRAPRLYWWDKIIPEILKDLFTWISAPSFYFKTGANRHYFLNSQTETEVWMDFLKFILIVIFLYFPPPVMRIPGLTKHAVSEFINGCLAVYLEKKPDILWELVYKLGI